MAVLIGSEDARLLRKLIPLASFPSEAFAELCAGATVERLSDQYLFKRGDVCSDLVYLLEGIVTLQAEGLIVDEIAATSESAKFALAHQIPRKIDGYANGMVRIVRLDAEKVSTLPKILSQPEKQGLFLDEEFGDAVDDWMSALLKLPLFYTIPPSKLQKIIISLQLKQYRAGELIFQAGSSVDYFYIITKGQCLLTRLFKNAQAELRLRAGDSFGDEYLLSGNLSQENVVPLTEVSVLQLDKKHFISELKKPLLQYITPSELADALQNGAIVLDVRLPHQFENHNMKSSANIPLMTLRMRLGEIPKDKRIIVVCANGTASEAAAFLLIKNNYNALVLKDGMGLVDGEAGNQKTGEAIKVKHSPLDELRAENDILTDKNKALIAEVARLLTEMDRLHDQNNVLTQQIERLKEILNRFTKNR